jgi:hypothetical protein
MESNDTASLINYFESVLGVKKFLVVPNASVNSAKPLIFIQDFKTYSASEIELTERILAAMNLDFSAVEIVSEIPNQDLMPDAFSIVFKDVPKDDREIYSPRTLQVKPELKKIAWDKLKML